MQTVLPVREVEGGRLPGLPYDSIGTLDSNHKGQQTVSHFTRILCDPACRRTATALLHLGANVPITSLTDLCDKVTPDLTIISFPIALPEPNATELVQALTHEVAPVSRLAVGGHGALAMRNIFDGTNIEVLEDFAEMDRMLDRLMRRSTSR